MNIPMRCALPVGPILLALVCAAPAQDSNDKQAAPPQPYPYEIVEEAVGRGFVYLKSQQNEDGSFGRGRFARNVGITSICALAFMADGQLPQRGDYGEQVERAIKFVLDHATETGFIVADNTSHGPMYEHGFATLFLGEAYGMVRDEDGRIRDVLKRAVDVIVGTQNSEGGWRYFPVPNDADISVTICQIMALRSARNAGIKVPGTTIERAIEYVRACQNPDGGFMYMRSGGPSAWPRSAAGVASLMYAGVYEDEAVERGLKYLFDHAFPGKEVAQAHYYYGHYYAAQVMYLSGREQWDRWWPAISDVLLDLQASNGSWTDSSYGDAYASAMALIILQMPKAYLPIFQK